MPYSRAKGPAYRCGHYWMPDRKDGDCATCHDKKYRDAHAQYTCAFKGCGRKVYRSPWHMKRVRDVNVVFCSHSHRNTYYAQQEAIEVPCSGCGKPTKTQRHLLKKYRNQYCSMKCRSAPNTTCDHCKAPIRRSPTRLTMPGRKFCSVKCRKDAAPVSNTQCLNCAKPLYRAPGEIKTGTRFFCSYECHSADYAKRRAEKKVTPNAQCGVCGAGVVRRNPRPGQNFWCSAECKSKGTSIRLKGKPNPHRSWRTITWLDLTCHKCGVEFQRNIKHRKAHTKHDYCTQKCAAAANGDRTRGTHYKDVTTPNCVCANPLCGKPMRRYPSDLASGRRLYCSQGCVDRRTQIHRRTA